MSLTFIGTGCGDGALREGHDCQKHLLLEYERMEDRETSTAFSPRMIDNDQTIPLFIRFHSLVWWFEKRTRMRTEHWTPWLIADTSRWSLAVREEKRNFHGLTSFRRCFCLVLTDVRMDSSKGFYFSSCCGIALGICPGFANKTTPVPFLTRSGSCG